ncbi:ceramide synthase 6 [Trichonephila clavata]|uniref:Ceramide synthase 6 n=1 Tax=Trichonephila clavata TaxID=2740835 RepID=A0A8X6GZ67_TRICU|nr:ceramide synthase 6 [Trichonephila clavata]
MELLQDINTWFWNDYVWLPPNVTWADISDTGTVNYAQFSDLYYAFKVALALLVVRYFLEQFVFSPVGCYLGLKPRVCREPDNKILEKAFSENGKIGYKQVAGLAKQLDWSERKVERWLRRRISRSKPSTLNKFTESAWRFTFYLCAFSYGLYTLWDKPWLYDTNHCFYDYPHHSVTKDVWCYYMLELGFYWSLTFSQFLDTKRKDFMQMFVHHIVTILLLTFSWTSNLFRIGSLVLVIHDFADVPLEAAKMAKYVERQRVADMCFAVFTVAWLISRLGLYPYRIIYSTLYGALFIVPMFPAYYVFNSLLCALQVLHIVWTWMIVKIALRALSSSNPGVKDLRSDSEVSSESNTENEAKDLSSPDTKYSSGRTS